MLCSIWYTSKLSPCWDLHSPVANQDLSTLKLFEMLVGTSVWCAVGQWWNSVDGKYVSWDGWGKSAAISPNNCFTVTSTFRQFFFNTETLPACAIQFLGMDAVHGQQWLVMKSISELTQTEMRWKKRQLSKSIHPKLPGDSTAAFCQAGLNGHGRLREDKN